MNWYSVAELIACPGLPGTHQAIARKADREGWVWRRRNSQGGGKEFRFDSLPPETQDFLKQQRTDGICSLADKPDLSVRSMSRDYWKAEFEGLEDRKLPSFGRWFDPRFQGHFKIQKAYERFLEEEEFIHGSKLAAQMAFCQLYNDRELDIDEEVYDHIPKISRSTLMAKRQRLNEGGDLMGLLDRRGESRKGRGLIDTVMGLAEAVEECLAGGIFSPTKIRYALSKFFEFEWLPSLGQIRYWVQNFARLNPQKWGIYKGKDMSPAFGKRDDAGEPNAVWELDSSPTDVMLKFQDENGNWKKRRFAVLGALDVFTRRSKVLVAERSNQEMVLRLLTHCVKEWGLPSKVRLDNGKEYKAVRVVGFLEDFLGVEIDRCRPYSPEEKPFVERFFGTFQHDTLELLPGYVGHSVTEREKLRKRGLLGEKIIDLELTVEEFQAWADGWCEEYHQRKHRGLGMSPNQRLEQAIRAGWKSCQFEDHKILDLAITEGADRTVRGQGIEVNGRFYVAPELRVGSKVHVRFVTGDPYTIEVFGDANLSEFICTATWRDQMEPAKLQQAAELVKRQYEQVRKLAGQIAQKSKERRKQLLRDPAKALIVNPEECFVTVELEGPVKPVEPYIVTDADREEYERRKEEDRQREQQKFEAKQEEDRRQQFLQEEEAQHKRRHAEILYRYLTGGDLTAQERRLLEYKERNLPPTSVVISRKWILEAAGLSLPDYQLLELPRLSVA